MDNQTKNPFINSTIKGKSLSSLLESMLGIYQQQ